MINNPAILAAASPATRQLVRSIYLENADAFASDFALVRLWRPADPPAIERLSSILVPTLVLVGDHDSPAARATAEGLAAAIAGSEMHVIPGAGHLLNLDAPDAFSQTVVAFLAHAG